MHAADRQVSQPGDDAHSAPSPSQTTAAHLPKLAHTSAHTLISRAQAALSFLDPPAAIEQLCPSSRWPCLLAACLLRLRSHHLRPKSPAQARFLHRGTSSTEAPSGRYLYIFGGSNKSSEFNDLWVLDKELSERSSSADASAGQGTTAEPPASAWQRLYADPAPQQRQSATLTAVGTKLLMFGGRQGETTFLNDTWIFDTVLCVWTCVRESDPMQPVVVEGAGPSLRWAHSAACFGDRVLFFGGSAPGRCFNDLHWFDMPTKRWSRQFTTGALPLARSGHCACALGESMFVFGGNTTKASFNDLWEYATRTETWKLVRASGARSARLRCLSATRVRD